MRKTRAVSKVLLRLGRENIVCINPFKNVLYTVQYSCLLLGALCSNEVENSIFTYGMFINTELRITFPKLVGREPYAFNSEYSRIKDALIAS